jgi:hypothetical protein
MPAVFEIPLFVSAPSDCGPEKGEILAAVDELNLTLGLRIDAFDSRRPHPTVDRTPKRGSTGSCKTMRST